MINKLLLAFLLFSTIGCETNTSSILEKALMLEKLSVEYHYRDNQHLLEQKRQALDSQYSSRAQATILKILKKTCDRENLNKLDDQLTCLRYVYEDVMKEDDATKFVKALGNCSESYELELRCAQSVDKLFKNLKK